MDRTSPDVLSLDPKRILRKKLTHPIEKNLRTITEREGDDERGEREYLSASKI